MPEDAKKDTQDIDESENVISVNDFDNLESKEKKKSVSGIFGKLVNKKSDKKKNDKDNSHDAQSYDPKDDTEIGKVKKTMDDITIKTDKIEGKLEMLDNIEKDKNEEISRLTEEIGELRSMIFDREKSSNDVLTKFEKIKDATEEINPGRIKKNMDRKGKKLLELEAKLEIETERNTKFEKQITKIDKVYENIKSIESLTNITKYIDKQIKKIKDEKDYINRTTSKVEQIFFELNKKQEALDSITEKIEGNKELMEDNVRAIDAVEMKFESMITKKDMSVIRKELGVRLDKTEEQMFKMKDLMTILIEKTMANETKIKKKEVDLSDVDLKIGENTELSKENVHAIKALEMKIEKNIPKDMSKIKEQLNLMQNDNKNHMDNIMDLISTLTEKTIANEMKINEKQDVLGTIDSKIEKNTELSEDNVHAIKAIEIKIEKTMSQDLGKIKKQLNSVLKDNKNQMDNIMGILSTLTEKTIANEMKINEKQKIADNVDSKIDNNRELPEDIMVETPDINVDNTIEQDTIENQTQIDMVQADDVNQTNESIISASTENKEIYERPDLVLESEDAPKTIAVPEQNNISSESEETKNTSSSRSDIDQRTGESLESLIDDYDSRIETKPSDNKRIA